MIHRDIALLRLPEPVESNDIIKPIPYACSSTRRTDVITIGVGVTKSNAKAFPQTLKYTELQTVSRVKCLVEFPYLILRESIICAEGDGWKSACRDSGGPLITLNNSLVGLISYDTLKGCESAYPSVFTRISYYQEWIKNVTGVECQK